MSYNLAELIAEVTTDASKRVEKMLAYVKMTEALAAEGVDMSKMDKWKVRYCDTIAVSKSDLSKVRRVVGRLGMYGKDIASDFDQTNEIIVTLKPVSNDYPFRFSYRSKFRKGGKCEVQEHVSQAYATKSLVCKV